VTKLVGWESDRYWPDYPGPNAISQTLVSNSPVNSVHGYTDVSNASIYQAPSGAWVFAAGTHQWSWGLTDVPYHYYQPDPRIQQTTKNILDRFVQTGAQPPPTTTTSSSPSSTTTSVPSSTTTTVGPTTTTTVAGSPSSYAAAVAADTPALDWQTRDTSGSVAHDATTNHRDGTYSGGYTLNNAGPITTDPASRSVTLDGSTGAINSTYNPFSGQTTFEGWFNRANATSTDALFGDSNGHIMLRLNGNDVQWFPNTNDSVVTWSSAWPGTNQWVYVVLEEDNTNHTARLRINNVDKGLQTGIPDYNPSPGTLMVGARGGPQDPWAGATAEIAIYNTLLGATRTNTHYHAAVG
jgi:hypothetical protein